MISSSSYEGRTDVKNGEQVLTNIFVLFVVDMSLKIGQRVSVKDRGFGTIAYIGKTSFAEGKWIGVILEKPLGKNNGTIQGKEYFKVIYTYS